MSGKRLIFVVFRPVGASGCGSPAPKIVDKTPPKIVLTAIGAAGNPLFASDEPVEPQDGCAKFKSFPGRWALTIDDAGGVAGAESPESSWQIGRGDDLSEVLMIRTQPPRPGVVRTGLFAMFSVAPQSRSASILASAWDFANNTTHLYQVDARLIGDAVACR